MVTLIAPEEYVPSRQQTGSSEERRRVATVLREGRQKLGLSQEEFAKRVGLSYAGYRPYEQSKRALSTEQIPQFAEALEITEAELGTIYNSRRMVTERLEQLERNGFIRVEEGRYRLTPTGRSLADRYLLFRKVFGHELAAR